jgi:hypothetical protein
MERRSHPRRWIVEDIVTPYSKRPPPSESLLPLGTGDFEAVSVGPRSGRAVQSARQAHSYRRYPAHYSAPPSAPASLAPVAMSSARSAIATGPQRAQPTIVVRSRPTAKTGVAILLVGAIVGGVFGIAMRLRQNAADVSEFAAHETPAEQAAPPPPPATPIVVAPGAAPPSASAPQQYSNVPFGSLVVAAPPASAPASVVASAAPPANAKEAKKHGAGWAKPAAHAPAAGARAPKAEKDDGYKIASADPEAKEPKAEPKEPKEAREPKEASKPKAEPKEAKKPARDSEAQKVLNAAMGATENTL